MKYRLMHVIAFCCMAGMTILGVATFVCQEIGNGAVLWYEHNDIIRRIEIVCGIIGLLYLIYIGKTVVAIVGSERYENR